MCSTILINCVSCFSILFLFARVSSLTRSLAFYKEILIFPEAKNKPETKLMFLISTFKLSNIKSDFAQRIISSHDFPMRASHTAFLDGFCKLLNFALCSLESSHVYLYYIHLFTLFLNATFCFSKRWTLNKRACGVLGDKIWMVAFVCDTWSILHITLRFESMGKS